MAITEKKLDLIEQIQQEKLRQRAAGLSVFLPDVPGAQPFQKQTAFLRDKNQNKIAKCGNRASKTCSMMRDLAWKITRTHWYRQDYNVLNINEKNWKKKLGSELYEELYLASKPKVFWIVGPTYDFVNNTMWGLYLKKMIPAWFVKEIKLTNQKNIDQIEFQNGDIIKCKTYSQQETTKMGYVVDGVYIDEMPPDVKTITELVVRTFDCDGQVTIGFTSLVQNEEIREYVDKACAGGTMSLHQWTIYDNPWYADNPDRLKRVLDEYAHLSETERNARLNGDWYYEIPEKAVFEGLVPEEVEDFLIPAHWRRARFTDPAAHITGHAEFAEDPDTGSWYCYLGTQITWGQIAKAEDILERINSFKPRADYRYELSKYDNAEAWFGAYGKQHGYFPCILKNREAAILQTRTAVGKGKLKFFKHGAKLALEQLRDYRMNKAGDAVVKRNDHVLDCVMYFCREIPERIGGETADLTFEQVAIAQIRDKVERGQAPQPPKNHREARIWSPRHPMMVKHRGRLAR
jgi:hypothetical protein